MEGLGGFGQRRERASCELTGGGGGSAGSGLTRWRIGRRPFIAEHARRPRFLIVR
jgi:hypothetical protein